MCVYTERKTSFQGITNVIMELASPKSGGWVGGWGPREEPMLWFKFRDYFLAELLPA